MDFTRAYNRDEFMNFLRNDFLPEDFQDDNRQVAFEGSLCYISQVTRLGISPLLRTSVYEIRHQGKKDPRVSLSREAFRILRQQSQRRALVLFVSDDDHANYRFSLITMSFTDDERGNIHADISNPRRYSYFLGEKLAGRGEHTPQQFLVRGGRVSDFKDLQSRFSVDALTDTFYNQLSDWYAWAIRTVEFPNDIDDPDDNMRFNKEAMIRLITRLIFVWFLKQKKLVPDEFFDESYIKANLIPEIDSESDTPVSRKSHYYKGILQNLFFAMLNSPITAEGGDNKIIRRFKKGRGDFNNNKLMRYSRFFSNPDKFVDLANSRVPFLNGGLFECLDDKEQRMYVDAFTENTTIEPQLIVPDYLFFGEKAGRGLDLTDFYGEEKTSKRSVDVIGLIEILRNYNFTIEENTPVDQDVSLDPELLGKAFENLLASFNPETQSQARKNTGSFYTPRDIVNYMVDESLVAYLKQEVDDELEPEYRKLLSYTEQCESLTDDQRTAIMHALYNCKILDPACGSGAFPMGCLQQMVHILTEVDPDNTTWREMLLSNAIGEIEAAETNEDKAEREEAMRDIERSFDESDVEPDYARKLYLIENCIYGVDIQSIAIQISKLRFFISLVVDEKNTQNPLENFGIRPLPNLEAKFVAANTLIGLDKQTGTFKSIRSLDIEKQLKEANHKIFNARSRQTKLRWRKKIEDLRKELADEMVSTGFLNEKEATMLASWDMFNQNASATFFDPEWMFGVENGFDVVIGNPPYVLLQNSNLSDVEKNTLNNKYVVAQYKVDLYHLFIERGVELLQKYGCLVYINPTNFLTNNYTNKLRQYILQQTNVMQITNIEENVFSASVNTCIINLIKSKRNGNLSYCSGNIVEGQLLVSTLSSVPQSFYDSIKGFVIQPAGDDKVLEVIEHINQNSTPLSHYASVSFGMQLRNRKLYPLDVLKNPTKEQLSQYHRKCYTGKDIEEFTTKYNNLYCYFNREAKCGGCWDESLHNTKNKIIVRQVGSTPICGIDTKGYAVLNSAFMIVCNKIDPFILLGILNSKLIKFYWGQKFEDKRKTFPKIKGGYLELIPICTSDNSLCNALSKEVNKRIYNDVNSEEVLNKIDFLVYHLYGLTYDEVRIIDSNPPFSREEYDRQ